MTVTASARLRTIYDALYKSTHHHHHASLPHHAYRNRWQRMLGHGVDSGFPQMRKGIPSPHLSLEHTSRQCAMHVLWHFDNVLCKAHAQRIVSMYVPGIGVEREFPFSFRETHCLLHAPPSAAALAIPSWRRLWKGQIVEELLQKLFTDTCYCFIICIKLVWYQTRRMRWVCSCIAT